MREPKQGAIEWWGYLHTSGSLQVKRYFSPLDISEAKESPFVQDVCGPWEVASRDEALAKLKMELGEWKEGTLKIKDKCECNDGTTHARYANCPLSDGQKK